MNFLLFEGKQNNIRYCTFCCTGQSISPVIPWLDAIIYCIVDCKSSITNNEPWLMIYVQIFFFSPKRLMTKRMIKVQGTLIRVGRTFYRVIRDYYFFEFIGKNIYLCISTTFTSKHTRTLEWNVQLVMRSCG